VSRHDAVVWVIYSSQAVFMLYVASGKSHPVLQVQFYLKDWHGFVV